VHHGQFFKSQGVFQVAPSIQRTPVLFQAGTSPRGLAFATRHAEAMFIGSDSPEKLKQQVERIRCSALQQGRAADDIKIFVGISVVSDATAALAQAKYADYQSYASNEAALAHYSSSEVIPYLKTNSIVSVNEKFKQQRITLANLKAQHALGGRYPLLVGSGAMVAEQLIDLVDQTGIDGFNLTRSVSPESHRDFIRHVIPELQQRRRFKTAYQQGSLRHKLSLRGDRLPQSHPVQQFRIAAQKSSALEH
jgi:alkanesulfonate monooxygenase SsuD/methylene tetrahydromethanopterin reductase-like flavin-dependent oxidoreductase (luciferase family)